MPAKTSSAQKFVTAGFDAPAPGDYVLDVLGPYSSAVLMNWYYYDLFVKGEPYLSFPIRGPRFYVPQAGSWFVVVFTESMFWPSVQVRPV